MFCRNCGNKSEGDNKFCTNCGTPFSAFKEDSGQTDTFRSPAGTPKTNDKDKTKKALKVLAAVVVIGFVIYSNIQDAADSKAIDQNNSALSAYELGNDDQAVSQLVQANESAVTNETKVVTLINLAYAYNSQGNTELMLATLKEAKNLAKPDSVEYYLILGEIAELEGESGTALIAYKKGYAKNPNDYQINNSLGLFYLDLQDEHPEYTDYKMGLTYAKKANEIDSNRISKGNLAIAYYFTENYSQAILLFKSLGSNSSPVYAYYLGLSYAQIDDTVNAKFYLQQAIDGGLDVPQEVVDYLNSN